MAGKHFHVAMDLQTLKKTVAVGKYKSLYLMVGDRLATEQEIIDNIIEAMGKGYEVLPPCDNVDSKGHCLGHEGE